LSETVCRRILASVARFATRQGEHGMSLFEVHTIETAPDGSKPLLENLQGAVGLIPNLAAAMAESPELLRGFLSIRQIFYGGTFSPGEIQVLALTNAFENGCRYCMAFHSMLALKEGVSREAVEALRAGRSPKEPKLDTLSKFSRALVKQRGHVGDDELRRLFAAGYSKAQALEVVLGVAVSILPNFAHHITQCPLDRAFSAHAWEAVTAAPPSALSA
jgi:AhpD family alkylhydroperoxidase